MMVEKTGTGHRITLTNGEQITVQTKRETIQINCKDNMMYVVRCD